MDGTTGRRSRTTNTITWLAHQPSTLRGGDERPTGDLEPAESPSRASQRSYVVTGKKAYR